MLLENKVAVIYGASGPIGGAVARAFAHEGAQVFVSARKKARVDALAKEIRAAGGMAKSARVDAYKEKEVNNFADTVARECGRIDISMNVIGYADVQKPLMEITVDEFLQPIENAMRSQFLTGRAAARHMIKNKSGVILAFGGNGNQTLPGLGGFKIALDAIEGLRRQWAVELSQYGIRVITLKTGGVPESIPAQDPLRQVLDKEIAKSALLKRAATLEDVGNVAAFAASYHARTITATEINISCGALID